MALIVNARPEPAFCLMGPTASGKTDMAIWLCERFPLEIISVDSALVYRDMNIGTAKPDAATLARAPHHLIDLLPPTEAYSVGRFRLNALTAMAEIRARGKIPLLVGGTMLYFHALSRGLDDLPPANTTLRTTLEARAAKEGWPALHAELARLDPETGARLQPNDAQRVQRALELYLTTGETLSALRSKQSNLGANDTQNRWHEFALFPQDRAWLHQRINLRFGLMLERGLVDELITLRQCYELEAVMPSMRCVGYRQAWQYLAGDMNAAELYNQGAAATRQLAKRQLTWLRGWNKEKSNAIQLDPLAPDIRDTLAQQIAMRLGPT
jgi:tRNA dimethylallyltransferase